MVDVNTEQLAHSLLAGKYQLGKIIGKGGMGLVFEGEDVASKQRVAVKCLHPALVTDASAVERFHREATAAGAISRRENVCEVLDFGTNELGIPYLVMPLLEGTSLETLFDSRLLTLDRLVDIVLQILSALEAAEEAGIIHRDLKPGNIFVSRGDDGRDLVKLLDFGISKILHLESVQKLTRTGAILGTPHYMSPEQASGMAEVDHRTDLYAVGIILYEGLTGRCPFEGDSYNEVICKIVSAPFVMPRRYNPLIPPEVEQVVLTAMAKDPAQRFAHAADMRAVLEKAQQTDAVSKSALVTAPATTPRGGAFHPASRSPQRKSGGVSAHRSAHRGAPSAVSPKRRGRGQQRGVLVAAVLLSALLLLLVMAYWQQDKLRRTTTEAFTRGRPIAVSASPAPAGVQNEAAAASDAPVEPELPKVTIPLFKDTDTLDTDVSHEITVPRDLPKRHRHAKDLSASRERERPTVNDDSPASQPRSPSKTVAPAPNEPIDTASEKSGLIKRGMTFEDQYE